MAYGPEVVLARQINAIRCRLRAVSGAMSPEQLEDKLDQLQALSMELGVMQQVRLAELGLGYSPVTESL